MEQRWEVVGAGRVDQNIDAAKFLDCRGDDGLRTGYLRHIAKHKSNLRLRKAVSKRADSAFAPVTAAAVDDDGLGACRQHRFRTSLADSGRAAGDQYGFSLQRPHDSALRSPQAST